MSRRKVIDYSVYLIVRILICVAQAVRIETGHSIAKLLAWLFCNILRIRHHVVEDNLAHAFPELSAKERLGVARRMWEHLFLMVVEIAQTPRKIHETNWRDYVALSHKAELVQCLLDNRPVMIVSAHLGNFEVGGYILGLLGFPTYTVARTLDNPYLDEFVGRFRGASGQHIIPKNGGFDQILAVLSNGGTMNFLADQYAGPKGCWVNFFGRQASAHKAIALLALDNNAWVSASTVRRLSQPMHFELINYAMIDPSHVDSTVGTIRDLTQWYTSRLEELIRCSPDQYWWLHRRWKDTREKKKRVKQAA